MVKKNKKQILRPNLFGLVRPSKVGIFRKVSPRPVGVFWGDKDGDGVYNAFDCQPNNPKKQGLWHKKKTDINILTGKILYRTEEDLISELNITKNNEEKTKIQKGLNELYERDNREWKFTPDRLKKQEIIIRKAFFDQRKYDQELRKEKEKEQQEKFKGLREELGKLRAMPKIKNDDRIHEIIKKSNVKHYKEED